MSALALALLLAGCAGASPPAAAPPADPCARPGESAMNLPPLEDGVLFQYLAGDREGQRSGFRVHADGRLERRSKDGPWAADAPLDAARLDALKAAIERAKLRDRPAVYRPEPAPDDATSWTLQARDGAGAVGLSGEGCRPAFVDALFAEVAPLLQP